MIKKQKELPGMPKRDALGEKAVEYLKQLDKIESQKLAAEGTRKELIVLFKKEEMSSIVVEGRTVSYAHTESDKISIKQQLDKNKEK